MQKLIALTAATILSTSTAALATGLADQSLDKTAIEVAPAKDAGKAAEGESEAAVGQAADAAAGQALAPKTLSDEEAVAGGTEESDAPGKNLAAAVSDNDKAMDESGVAYAEARETHLAASAEPADEQSAAMLAAAGTGDPAKQLGTDAPSPFGAVSEGELAALAKNGEETAMGGPLDPADMIEEGWDSHDVDADGALTPLEFGRWIADDAGKDEFAAAAEEERASAAEGTATVQLLNGTALEFSQADADGDARVSAEELSAYMEA